MKLTIDIGFLTLQREVDPAGVGLELAVAGAGEELAPRRVERRHAGVAAARQVDGGEVERQAEQVVAQRFRHELVDLVADLARHAAHDGAGRLVRRSTPPAGELERIEEGLDQADVVGVEVGIIAIDRLGQHRVAEAIDRVRELGHDRGIDGGVVGEKMSTLRLDLARELLEHEVLVLHLGAELGGLEQALAVPHQRREIGRDRCNVDREPLVQERDIARPPPRRARRPWCARPAGCAPSGTRGARRSGRCSRWRGRRRR